MFQKGYLFGCESGKDSVVLPVVNVYKYFGILFSTKLSFTASCHDLTNKARSAVLCIMQKLRMLNNNSLLYFWNYLILKCSVFSSTLELCGLETTAVHCEKVHLFALKKILGVELRTPNDFVYGETNRYPLFVNSVVRCIRYRLKLTRMEASKLPNKADRMLHVLDEQSKRNWASNVRLNCIEMNLVLYGWIKVWKKLTSFYMFFVKECRWQE